MTEVPSYGLPPDDNNLLSSTAKDAIATNIRDFNKYDRYVEKIRALFVPSLEPRIYSCLETFVYLQDSVEHSDPPYLRRCLNVAATWRDPVEAFCTKWRDAGFLEKMLTNAAKFLIRDGLINCFLDSIVLNNRLNKVCRDLDALGVEKDLTRYLSAWNYINERDYWLDDDKRISTSDRNYYSTDRQSDLNVEVGSILGGRRYDRSFKRAFKRRANDDSSEDLNKNYGVSNEVRENEEIRDRFPSRVSVDSSIPEGSRSSSARKKIRSCKAYPCRASTCTSYRMKNVASGDWKGKTLKLQLSNTPLGASEYERELVKPSRLSKLPLPCKFDDLIAEIVKVDSGGSYPIRRGKKFYARVTRLCSRVNDILGKIDKKEVARCRLHSEILPEYISFKLIERESDGYKVCLFCDRVAINRIDRPNVPRGSSSSNLKQIDELKTSEEAEVTIYKNTGFASVDDESRIVRSLEEEPVVAKQLGDILLRLSDEDLETYNKNNLELLGEKDVLSLASDDHRIEKLICDCNTAKSTVYSVDYAIGNSEENINAEFEKSTKKLIRKESLRRLNSTKGLTGKESLNRLNSMKGLTGKESLNRLNSMKGLTRKESLNRLNSTKGLTGKECLDRLNSTKGLTGKESLNRLNSTKGLTGNESLKRLTKTAVADEILNRSNSVDDKIDQPAKNEQKDETKSEINLPKSLPGESVNCLNENVFGEQTSNCNNFIDDSRNVLNRSIEENYDIQTPNNQISDVSDFVANSHKNKSISDTILDDGAEIHRKSKLQSNSTGSSATLKYQSDAKMFNQLDNIACACPSDCTCPNKCIEEKQLEQCDSRCSCDSCGELYRPAASFKKTEVTRMSSLLKPVGPHSMNPEVQNSHKSTSTQSNEVSALGNDEFPPAFLETQVESSQSRGLEFPKEKSITSAISLESNVTRVMSFIDAETKPKPVPLPAIRLPRSVVNDSPKKLSIEEHPIVSPRFSRPKSQRINISIEMCSESASSIDNFPKIRYKDKGDELKDHKDEPLLRKSRCHSVEMQDFAKQALPHHDKNTTDACLRRPRGIDARVHSTPRSLESQDSVPPFESSSSMRNPIVYGMSTKSGVSSIGNIARRSIDRENRQRSDKLSYGPREICNVTKNSCRSMKRKERTDKREETRKRVPRITMKSEAFSPRIIQNNLCHAFSASSVDRMKHLIRTKLRRILLERDKATNTSKMTLTNKKYRVSVPNGKNDRSLFRQQRCRTIWESRSASDSTRTSRSFVSNDRITSDGFCHREEAKNRIYSSKKIKDSFNESRNFDRNFRDYDRMNNVENYYLKNRETSSRNLQADGRCSPKYRTPDTNLNTNFRRLAGGSDIPYRKCIEGEVVSKRMSRNFTKKCATREHRSVFDNKNFGVEEKYKSMKTAKYRCEENSEEAGDSTASRRREFVRKKILDEFTECSKLDCSGNSTSRHIYLYEFDRLASSCDETESPFWERENSRLPSKHCSADERSASKGGRQVFSKNVNNPRPRVPSVSGNNRAANNFSCETKRPEGFANLDRDLRKKLSQYVNLCKSVKYSLLKRLRPDDIYEVSRTSISCCDRYKFGDS